MTFVKQAHIMGKDVKQWGRTYDLKHMWGNKWLPVKPHYLPDYRNASQVTLSTQDNNNAGCMFPSLQGSQAISQNIVNQVTLDTLVCPVRPAEYIQPMENIDSEQSATNFFGQINQLHHVSHMPNLFLMAENLPNPDGTVVPIIWDFYMDTEIQIEAEYDAGVFMRDWLIMAAGTNVGPEDPYIGMVGPDPANCVYNKFIGSTYTDHSGRQAGSNTLQSGFSLGEMGYLGNTQMSNSSAPNYV